MASFKVVYGDGSLAKNTKVTISVDRGGVKSGITDSHGYVSITTSNTSGKIIVNGRTIHIGSLNVSEVIIR